MTPTKYSPQMEDLIKGMARQAIQEKKELGVVAEPPESIDSEELKQRVADEIKVQEEAESKEPIKLKEKVVPKSKTDEQSIMDKAKEQIGFDIPEDNEELLPKIDKIVPPINIAVLEMAKGLCDDCSDEDKRDCKFINHGECCDTAMETAQKQYDHMVEKGLFATQGTVFDPYPPKAGRNYSTQQLSHKGFVANLTSGLTGVMFAVVVAVVIGYFLSYSQFSTMNKQITTLTDTAGKQKTELQADEATINSLQQQINQLNNKVNGG
jgi:polyhydroxyalkanoate synthesis regulator phasin